MKFIVDKEILQHYPSLHLGAIILKNFDNSKRISVIESLLRGANEEKIRDFSGKKIEEDPRVKVWKKTYKSFDFDDKNHFSNLEDLLKKAIGGKGKASGNSLVDICNLIALKYCIPIQAHDIDELSGNLRLTYAAGSEYFVEEGKKAIKVKSGEVVYRDDAGVLSRGWNWQFSARDKISTNTNNALVLFEDMGVLGTKGLEDAIKDFIYFFKKYEGIDCSYSVISSHTQELDLGVEGVYGITDDESGELHIFEKKSIGKVEKLAKPKAMDYETYIDKISKLLQKTIKKSFAEVADSNFVVEESKDVQHGDYASNLALQLGQKLKSNPRETAEKIVEAIKKPTWIEKIEVAGPGFINFFVSKKALTSVLENINAYPTEYGNCKGKTSEMLVEFAHPNTHKAFHIGHLRNITLGESLVRLLESQGVKVHRANYQGDVGPHVAKCLWGYMKSEVPKNLDTNQAKAEFLGKVYAIGAKAYEASEDAKKEIDEINKQIYQEDGDIMPLWRETRQWSLDYFDEIYQRLGSYFDRLYFESEVWKSGFELVQNGLKKGVFEESKGAIIYDGEKHNLHKRVFITSQGNLTYEGKEVGLAQMENTEFKFDKKIHVVAHEQSAYFQVVFKAIEQLMPELEGRQEHVPYGMVKLPSGKMSSRTGDVITAESLLEEAKSKVAVYAERIEGSQEEKEAIIEKVALGAVKFTMLNATSASDIVFELEKVTQLEGATGPYLQYAYARIQSIIKKVNASADADYDQFNDLDWLLIRKMLHFPEMVTRSANDLSPHHLARYLIEIAGQFSGWYDKNSVLNTEDGLQQARLDLVVALASIIKKGLNLLGIEVPDKM